MLLPELEKWRVTIEKEARKCGLDFFDTIFELLDWKQMNEVAAYGGFPNRYPHWRFGMEFEKLSKSYAYGLSKIYEMVINNNPCYAYLLHSNHLMDQKLVMAHVFGHCDFFKNNIFFQHTNRHMIDEMANHKSKIQRYVNKYGYEAVESFIDVCLSIDNLIDHYAPLIKRTRQDPEINPDEEDIDEERKAGHHVKKLKVSREYLDHYINPKEFIQSQKEELLKKSRERKKIPEEPVKDVLSFLLDHAPLDKWQWDILSMIREEAYYFAPQGQTKIMNEGWACVAPDTLVFSSEGLIPMKAIVLGGAKEISDGNVAQKIYGQNMIKDHRTITLYTRRGFKLCGSDNHRILSEDGKSWKRLDELKIGDQVAIKGGQGLWPKDFIKISWIPPYRFSLQDVATEAQVSIDTVIRYRAGRSIRNSTQVAQAMELYDSLENQDLPQAVNKRLPIKIPTHVTSELGSFLGYLVGDGHISRIKRHVGITTGDKDQAEYFSQLSCRLFGLLPRLRWDKGRYRVLLHSEALSDFLVQFLKLTTGPSASSKQVPDLVLRSPEPVIREFISSYFDCDAYAGKQGVILSSTSRQMIQQVQLLLLNYNILSRVRSQKDGCWHLHITGNSAAKFAQKIGFHLRRKQKSLEKYVQNHRWFKEESFVDQVVSLNPGRGDVYDISVGNTHRYVAAGLINHNSFWHSRIMTQKILNDSEIIDFADHHSGTVAVQPGRLNPYKLGLELFRDIEERWNKGRFGKEYDECDDMVEKLRWNKNSGLGGKKIFEVRKIYNDVTFIDAFLTREFCVQHKLFAFDYNKNSSYYEISSREFKEIKEKLLFSLTNFGQPFIFVQDANYGNRAELLLWHRHEGVDLKLDYAREVLKNIYQIWKRPVLVETKVGDKLKIYSFDGKEHHDDDTKEGL